jgi:peptidoglycan hydrolase-like protein with peptidoglycan-binding domain
MPHPVALLQQQVGNAAVGQLLQGLDDDSAARGEGEHPWLRAGATGDAVAELQTLLNAAGTAGTPLTVTSRFDRATLAVVRQFQQDTGIAEDGVAGPHTWEALDRLSAPGTAEDVSSGGADFFANTRRIGPPAPADPAAPAPPEPTVDVTELHGDLNPTEGGGEEWDGRRDRALRAQLKTDLLAALQAHLDANTPHMRDMEAAKAAGNVLSTQEREGAGAAAKRTADAVFGNLASAAVLTTPQAHARAAFRFQAGVNLLDASDSAVRRPDPRDLAEWMSDTDDTATDVQSDHHFNRRRRGQGEGAFFDQVLREFIGTGSNRADLRRYDRFGFAFSIEGPRVLSQVAVVASDEFTADVPAAGGPSDAERAERWATWKILVHEYFHTLAHPAFNRAARDNRVLTEGFCEFFTKAVLDGAGAIAAAQADADPALRIEVEGGDFAGFNPAFVSDYSPGSYEEYLSGAESIAGQVGAEGMGAAFFLGHVELIGLRPEGEDVDPTDVDDVGPSAVVVPDNLTSVTAVSILTGAPEADIIDANPGLQPDAPLPATAHTDGLRVPGTSFHRVVASRDRSGRAVETKELIARQHGTTEEALVRANPRLNHRQPREGEWLLIPVH